MYKGSKQAGHYDIRVTQEVYGYLLEKQKVQIPMPDKRNVEINVRCEKELEPDHKMLDSLIVTWLETDKDPPLFAWAQAFKVPVDIISVETIKRADSAKINVRIEF